MGDELSSGHETQGEVSWEGNGHSTSTQWLSVRSVIRCRSSPDSRYRSESGSRGRL